VCDSAGREGERGAEPESPGWQGLEEDKEEEVKLPVWLLSGEEEAAGNGRIK
jgi:hypothetical protein